MGKNPTEETAPETVEVVGKETGPAPEEKNWFWPGPFCHRSFPSFRSIRVRFSPG